MKKILIVLFAAFLGGFLILNLALPDRAFSPLENRNLAQAPAFSLQRVFSGAFEADAEAYVTDQFAFRDGWMAMKAGFERLLGKKENNGVYLCGSTLIERVDQPDEERVALNIRAVNRFVESAQVPVYFTLLPTAQEIWREKLPAGAPGLDEAALIVRVAADVEARYVDTLSALRAHADEPLFYRTDHHWTSLGAYRGSAALLEGMGLSPAPLDAFAPQTVSTAFYGTLYSKSGARFIQPDSIDVYVPEEGVSVTRYENGGETPGALYDWARLEEKDKYSFFMGGNQPLAVIETGREGQKLLLVRDSYADSEVPFLTAHFSEIHMVDLRYYREGLADYIAAHGIDCVVISYSVRNFITDTNLHFMN
ncbi:MAG: hypothetical protein IJ048_14200 [Clostridia bacterium]|nr:hypothetical protein [Clostridia bacterium]